MKKVFYVLGVMLSLVMPLTELSAQQLVFLTNTGSVGIIANPSLPSVVIGPFPVSGVAAGQTLEGIDFRPNTGQLYALGYNGGTMEASLYVINPGTGAAMAIGTPVMLDLVPGSIGFDFNPTVDRIRVVSSNGKNYRLHPVTGAIAATDADLNYALADPNNAQTPDVVACAYTRSYIASESTTLYDIDASLNILASQVPPNNGVLNTIGSTGIIIDAADRSTGFDIYFDPASGTDMAYVSANVSGNNDNLYQINLSNGQVNSLGVIGLGVPVRDIAAVITRTVPALSGREVFALTQNAGSGNLITFDSDNPGIIRSWKPLTGITAGQNVLGMDFRPANGSLLAFAYNATAMNYQLYTVDTASGMATAINAVPVALMLDTALTGFDFNPTVDRIRLTGAGGENYRLNPVTGAIAATDTMLSYAAGDPNAANMPYVATVAYTNSYAGATATMLLGYDDVLNVLLSIAPPNAGVCNTLGASGLMQNSVSRTTDMDIYFDNVSGNNEMYFVANTGTSAFDRLYSINGNTFTDEGMIGYGVPVKDIAIPVGEAPTSALDEAGSAAALRLFPNPAADFLYVSATGLAGSTLELIDMSGRVRMSTKALSDVQMLPVQDLPAGTYILKNGERVQKFVVLR